ncbi:PAS domain S-box-containing protein [Skermanella aerolata]|uniref:HWE histidine kinase domain-containing protein n=1 Tax=Skermanella aerolata TaxID=393310 RepID=UPI003D2157A1
MPSPNEQAQSGNRGDALGSELFAGGGEAGRLMRSMDWAATPLGPPEGWPRSLKTCVRILLTSRQAMFVWWGDHLINLHNDAYRSILGGKHPWALGQPASAVWREIWDQVGPRAESAMHHNEGTYDEALLLLMERNGYREETYYTFSYSPVPNDEGGTGGIICANTDDTQRIVGGRQLALLQELAARASEARTIEAACARSVEALETNRRDLPFAMIYMIDPATGRATLAGTSGIEPGHDAAPLEVDLNDPSAVWPLGEAMAGNAAVVVPDLSGRFRNCLPSGAWDQPPTQAIALPVTPAGQSGRAGVLVAGLNPCRLFDEGYQGFMSLVAGQVAAAIGNAQAYEEERRRAEALAEIDRAKTAFFSNVSHEFRTPLTLMLGPLEDLTAMKDLSPKGREAVEVAHRNSLRLLKLVNMLLDFSRIEAGRAQAAFEPTDLATLTADLASSFRSACDKAGLELIVDCPPLPRQVHVDREMWEKIVLNLISNAFKFTLAGSITVSLRPSADDASARLAVSDTGTGIAADELPRLFERFHRVEGAQGRTHEGSGIGLALVQELANLHGGSASAESILGQGSTFTITVPFGAAHLPERSIGARHDTVAPAMRARAFVEEALRWLPDDDTSGRRDAVDAVPAGRDEETVRQLGRPRVLVADDNADMRDYVARLLSTTCEVEAVADGQAALDAIRTRLPDLLLTDVMMPRLDGFALLDTIRADRLLRDLPVVMLSARAGEEAKVEGLDAGADDYLVKPFSARELKARVRASLVMARLRAERREAEASASRAEERLRAALLASGTGTFRWDMRTGVLEWDDALDRLFGLDIRHKVATMPDFLDLVHPEDRAAVTGQCDACMSDGADLSMEYRVPQPDGSVRWILDQGKTFRGEDGRPSYMTGACVDITERKRAEASQHLLLEELNHRVKNTLAMVQSIASQTLRATPAAERFPEAFQSRLQALAQAHDLLTKEQWRGASLREVAEMTLNPHTTPAGRVKISGPAVALAPGMAVSLHLALHELATNAAKYGALSVEQGEVKLEWAVTGGIQPSLRIEWGESGGPLVVPPQRRGFGSRLIERGLAHEVDGEVDLDFSPQGVVCRVVVPLSNRIAVS